MGAVHSCNSWFLRLILSPFSLYRDEAQNKMMALKERNDKDMAQHETEMKDLQRIIKHDNKLKEFMGIKVHDRADLKEEELAKKRKGKGNSESYITVRVFANFSVTGEENNCVKGYEHWKMLYNKR